MLQSTWCGYGLIKVRMKKSILFRRRSKNAKKRTKNGYCMNSPLDCCPVSYNASYAVTAIMRQFTLFLYCTPRCFSIVLFSVNKVAAVAKMFLQSFCSNLPLYYFARNILLVSFNSKSINFISNSEKASTKNSANLTAF